jgi:hypothetical protein
MSRKPLLYTAIAAPVFLITSIPLAFIVGVIVNAFTGTVQETVGTGDTTIGVIAALLTMLVFVSYCSYATYSYTTEKYGPAA